MLQEVTDHWVQAVVVAAGFALWFAVYLFMLRWTAPASVDPAPATQDLPGEEPPAVVSLLANRWRLNEDAVESTLLDLAARRWIELRQPGADPMQTTVHVLTPPKNQPQNKPALNPYEQQVLDRIRAEARGGVVPVTALSFRDQAEANRWTKRFESAVIDDARARGLTQRRFSAALVSLLGLVAVVPGILAGLFAFELDRDPSALGLALVVIGALGLLAGRPLGERDTEEGRRVARGWLGVKAFLKNDEAFAALPPSAVMVWDRYLSYGDALGTTRVCAMLLDLGMGDRTRVWSSYTGGWRQIRVTYPRFWGRYGVSAPRLLLPAIAQVVVAGWFTKIFAPGVSLEPDGIGDSVQLALTLIGGFVVLRGLYRIGRTLGDLAAPRTLTGEVLWVELFRTRTRNEETVEIVHHLALDDGTADRTTAWSAPTELSGFVRDGDEARIVVRPWSRRVTSVTRLAQRHERLGDGESRTPVSLAAAKPPEQPLPVPAWGSPSIVSVLLLTNEQVSNAFGGAVTHDGRPPDTSPGGDEVATFTRPGESTPLFTMAVSRSGGAGLLPQTHEAPQHLQGIGDEAWRGPDWAVARKGSSVVRLSIQPGSGLSTRALPSLLLQAIDSL